MAQEMFAMFPKIEMTGEEQEALKAEIVHGFKLMAMGVDMLDDLSEAVDNAHPVGKDILKMIGSEAVVALQKVVEKVNNLLAVAYSLHDTEFLNAMGLEIKEELGEDLPKVVAATLVGELVEELV